MTMRQWTGLLGGASLAVLMAAAPARAADITLHALMEDVPETTIIEALLPDFEKETGIKVEFQKLVYSEMHDKLVTQLTGNASYYNVLEVDFLWAGEFPEAGWLADLQPFVDKTGFDLKPFIPSMMDLVGTHKGTLYMIPMYNYSMGLLYRTDLMNDPKLKEAYKAQTGKDLAVPTTLADYVEMSKFMNANAGVSGSAMQSQRGDPNSMEFSNYLFANGGHYLDNGKVVLDSPEGIKALELYVDNIKNGAQKGALSATLDDTFRLMCDGKAWSMVTYWWMLPQVDNKDSCPNAAGKVAIAVMPGGHGESGGWGWAIPKNESPGAAGRCLEVHQLGPEQGHLDQAGAAGPCTHPLRHLRGPAGARQVPLLQAGAGYRSERRILPGLHLHRAIRGRARPPAVTGRLWRRDAGGRPQNGGAGS